MMLLPALVLSAMLAPASVEKADAAWAEGRYAEAASAYAQAYAETGDIAYLYARAQAQQEAGDCAAAIATYEAFIATEPLPEAVAAAEDAVKTCRARLPEPAPAPEAEPVAEPSSPPPEPIAPADPPDRAEPVARPWQRDPAAAVLVAVGSAGIVSGVVLAVVARTEQDAAERASDVVGYGEHNDRAVALSRASIPVLVVGGALVIGGAVRYGLLARKHRAASARVRLGPSLSIRF
jgi:tetratricopeptide (TPR) repeat protein